MRPTTPPGCNRPWIVSTRRSTASPRCAARSGHDASAAYLDDVVSRIEDTDVPTAMTQLAQDQALLQASFTITGRLAGLSLADYLR